MAVVIFTSGCSKGSHDPQASQTASSQATPAAAQRWTDNGATACSKYLTPAVLSTLVKNPNGSVKSQTSQGCAFGASDGSSTVSITLTAAGPTAFKAEQAYFTDVQPVGGVGDGAVLSMTGLSSYKGNNRGCDINVTAAPGFKMLKGQDLAAALGKICNDLFALP